MIYKLSLNIGSVVMLSEKKKRSCPFWSAKRRGKKAEKGFQKDWAVKLAKSDKGSFYYQDEWLQDENNKASEQKPIICKPFKNTVTRNRRKSR